MGVHIFSLLDRRAELKDTKIRMCRALQRLFILTELPTSEHSTVVSIHRRYAVLVVHVPLNAVVLRTRSCVRGALSLTGNYIQR